MATADVIRKLCKEKGISVTTLEETLGFSNGSLTKGSSLRSDRLLKVAEYFGVSVDYLMQREISPNMDYYQSEETTEIMQELFESPGRRALFKAVSNMTEEEVQRYADFIEGITNGNNKNN